MDDRAGLIQNEAGVSLHSGSFEKVQGLSTWATTFLIVGEIAGVGILALTNAVVDAGISGFILLPFFCILSTYTAHLLCQCWNIVRYMYPEYQRHVPNPYPVIGSKSFGRIGEFVVTTSINLTMFGAMVVFIVLGAQQLHAISASVQLSTSWSWSITFCLWMVLITGLLIPLSWLGTPKDFWWAAVLAMIGTAVACVLIVVNTIRAAPLVPESDKESKTLSAEGYFLALGTIMFAFSGHPAFPTIAIDMQQPEQFTRASVAAYLLVFAMYAPVVVTGYVSFGFAIKDDIVLSLSQYLGGDVCNTVIQACICVHLLCAFTIVANPVLQHAEELLAVQNKFGWQRVLVRTVLVLLALFCAESVPRFGVLVSLVGSSTNAMLVYVIPSACYLSLKHSLHKRRVEEEHLPLNVGWSTEARLEEPIPLHEKAFLYIIITIGFFGVITGTVTSMVNIIDTDTFVPPCYINCTVTP